MDESTTYDDDIEREQVGSDARSLGRGAGATLRKSHGRIGGGLFIGIALLCLIGPFFVPHSHETTQLAYGAQAPSWTHWFGTDELGRDILMDLDWWPYFYRCGLCGDGSGLLIIVVYGMIAGYNGGRIEATMMRFVDTLYALPFTIMVIC